MRAIRINEQGGPEVMHIEEVAVPTLEANMVLVKVEAVGINFIEIYQRSGQYKLPLPFTPGSEAAGVVEAVGDGVTLFKKGDRVVSSQMRGTYAEYAVAPQAALVSIPDGVTSQQAAAAILQGITAHYLTHSTYPLKPGDTALIHAAGGGTGQLLVQIAKRLGATVIGTASNAEKIALARAAGADEVINYTQSDFEVEVKRITNGKGVNVVYDSVGNDTFDRSLNCLRPRGYMVLFGQSSGAVAPVDPQLLNAKGSLFLTRPTVWSYIATRDELEWRTHDLFSWIAAGELKVNIDKTFPLEQAAAAHEYLGGRQSKGKVLLLV
jgi:NADPH:quinone reductase